MELGLIPHLWSYLHHDMSKWWICLHVCVYIERESRCCDFGKKNAALLLCCVLCTLWGMCKKKNIIPLITCSVYIHIHIHIHIRIRIRIRIRVRVRVRVCIYIYINNLYIYIYMYTVYSIHVYIYIHILFISLFISYLIFCLAWACPG